MIDPEGNFLREEVFMTLKPFAGRKVGGLPRLIPWIVGGFILMHKRSSVQS